MIPFWMTGAYWSAKTPKDRQLAEVRHKLTGYELAKRVAEIENEDQPEHIKKMALLKVDFDNGKIDLLNYRRKLADHDPDFDPRDLVQTKLLLNEITPAQGAEQLRRLDYPNYADKNHPDFAAYLRRELSDRIVIEELSALQAGIEAAQLDFSLGDIEELQTKEDLERAILGIRVDHDDITPYDYDMAILEMDHPLIETTDDKDKLREREIAKLKIAYTHDRITERDYRLDVARLKFGKKSLEYQIEEVEVDYSENLFNSDEYEKRIATVKGEPWFKITESKIETGEKGPNGVPVGAYSMEADWNQMWIRQLMDNGYVGASDEEVISQWLTELFNTKR